MLPYETPKFAINGIYGISLTTLHHITYHMLPPLHTTPAAIMYKSCIVCSVVASPTLQLEFCDACHSAVYCSRACQRIDWKKQHKRICKLLNVGHGDRQMRNDRHESRSNKFKDDFEITERNLDEGKKRFFNLFRESTFERSRDAAKKMKKYAKRQCKQNQEFLLYHSLYLLIRFDSDMLSWPNSPLLVLLQFVDPNVLFGDEPTALQAGENRYTPLHHLVDLADPFDYSTHEKQLILAKQLIEHGANVNAVVIPNGKTPLHDACSWENVTNLDFVELLVKEGADPNIQDYWGATPLMCTTWAAPGAAKFLLNWPTTDANITTQSGTSFWTRVGKAVKYLSNKIALHDNPQQVQHQFLLQQWRGIEEMLVERV
jgi:hypothetical protein